MKVLDIFSWLPAKEISLEQLEQIFKKYYNGTYNGEYGISFETPDNVNYPSPKGSGFPPITNERIIFMKNDILNCSMKLMKEGKKIAYISKDDTIIAVIGYTTVCQ